MSSDTNPPARSAGSDPAGAAPAPFARDELLERIDGDRELLLELVQLFRQGLPALVTELQAAVAAADPVRVHRAGHTLKGALLNLSAHPAAALARDMDDASRRGDLSAAPATLARLCAELDRLVQALDKEAVGAAA